MRSFMLLSPYFSTIKLMLSLSFILTILTSLTYTYPSKVIIKSFTCKNEESKMAARALRYAVDEINSRDDVPFRLSFDHHDVEAGASEAWGLVTSVCNELKEGGMTLISIDGGKGYEAIRGLADTLEMPLISITPPPYQIDNTNFFEVNIRPSTAEILADFIIRKDWQDVIIFNDGDNSGIPLPSLWHHLHKKTNKSISAHMLELPSQVEQFDEFLRQFHIRRFNDTQSQRRGSNKNLKNICNNTSASNHNRIIIDTTSSTRLEKLLIAIRSAQFNQAKYHYVIGNFDFLPYDVEMFHNGNINISGFQLINREVRGYWNLRKQLKKGKSLTTPASSADDLDVHSALAHDAILVAYNGFASSLAANDSLFHGIFRHGRFYNRGFPGIFCDPAADGAHTNRPFASFEHGRTISKALRSMALDSRDGTLTGNIQFDRQGERRNYDVSVIDLSSNTKATFNSKEVTVWRQGVGFLSNRTIAQHTRKPLDQGKNRVVKIITTIVAPFVMIRGQCDANSSLPECQGNGKYQGYCIELLSLLAQNIQGFNYEIMVGTKAGSRQSDGSWDGMIGELLRGRADMIVASLTINQERERVVDFSKPFMTTGISIMIKKPDKQEFSVFSFMQPLSTEIWMYIIFAYIGVSVVIFLVSRFSPYEWRVEETARGGFTISNDFSVYNCLWFTLAAFMQQGTDILPRSISGRIASSAWWFFTMIIVSSYTANLAAFLTLEKMQAPINGVEDLAKQTKIKYGIQGGGSTAAFFQYSSVEMYRKMWSYMESQNPSVLVNNYDDGINKVRTDKGRYAFLLEATANDFTNTRQPCDTMKVGTNLNSIGYGIATPFGSDWKDLINLAILYLQEKGELKKLELKWWVENAECKESTSTDGSSPSLNLSKVAGIFYILAGGMIAAMLAALGEFLYRSRIEARKSNSNSLVGNFAKNIKSALSSQLRLSVQGGAVAQPGTQSHEALKRQQAASFLPASNNDKDSSMASEHRLSPTYQPYNTAV